MSVSRYSLVGALLFAAACSDGTQGSEEREDENPGEASSASVGPGGVVITWGSTGIEYDTDPGRLALLDKFFERLTPDGRSRGEVHIRYLHPCDPREDPELCRKVSSLESLEPFLDLVSAHGELTYGELTDADAYDFVIATGCRHPSPTEEDAAALLEYLAGGGRVLLVGQKFCVGSTTWANQIAGPLGLTFTDDDPAAMLWEIPTDQASWFTEGITTVQLSRLTPQLIEHDFEPILTAPTGVIAAIRHDDP